MLNLQAIWFLCDLCHFSNGTHGFIYWCLPCYIIFRMAHVFVTWAPCLWSSCGITSDRVGSHFVQVRPKIICIWTNVRCKIKEYVIWRWNNVNEHSLWTTPTLVIILWCLLVHENHNPFSYVYVCTKSNHLQACATPKSVAIAGPGRATLVVCRDCCCTKHMQ